MSTDDTVRILLNGEPTSLTARLSVAQLLGELDRDPRTVAVEFNGEILPRSRYKTTVIVAGDELEIVHFVQGG
jgi:sulfur carrier protein